MMVTAKSRAAALGVPELPRRNFWYQRWGGTDPQRQRSQNAHQPRLQNSLIKKFNLPNQPLLLHATQTNMHLSAGRECGCNAGVAQSWLLHAASVVSHDFTTSLSERVLLPSRWWGTRVSNTGCSVSSWASSCVWEFSAPDRKRKALQEATPRCAQRSFLQESQREQSLQLSCLFRRTTVLSALNGHRQGSTFMGSDISELSWYLTKSFSDGDGTFISSKENLLK